MSRDTLWVGPEQSCPFYGQTRFRRLAKTNSEYFTITEVKIIDDNGTNWARIKNGLPFNPVRQDSNNVFYVYLYERGDFVKLYKQ